jgi:hypothetical protein
MASEPLEHGSLWQEIPPEASKKFTGISTKVVMNKQIARYHLVE